MKYTNPILPGFHPDPSICRVGDDYYLVTSSFEYFPAIPIFHSKNLIDWEQIGYCITNSDWLPLMHGVPNCSGIYAPTIRYHKGRYYVICTNVSTSETKEQGYGNFIVSTEDPYKGWSKPVFIDCPGIDPSLFFGENGKVYYCGTERNIYLCEINPDTGEVLSGKKYIWQGTGGTCPEGPHIYQKDGWYYLMIAEGGTEYGHMVTMARSKEIWGPYESCPNNPILTNRSTGRSIMAVGHADLIEDKNQNWWAVCLCNRPISYPPKHNLGRETSLVPVSWDKDGWPSMGNNGIVEEVVEIKEIEVEQQQKKEDVSKGCRKNRIPKTEEVYEYREDFKTGELSLRWNYLYNPNQNYISCTNEKGLSLTGMSATLSDADTSTFVGCRQEHHRCRVSTRMEFAPMSEGEEAGIAVYLNRNHHYELAIIRKGGQNNLMLRRKIGTLWNIECQIPWEMAAVYLKIEASKTEYAFFYSSDGENYLKAGSGETAYLTTEVGGGFTGNYFALYATGNGKKSECCADFSWFHIQGN